MGSRIALVGAGRMGLPIAVRLSARGFAVTVWDTDAAARQRAGAAGLVVADSVAGAVASADVLVTVLPGPTELADAAAPALDALAPSGLWLDLTSSDPRVARALAARATARGIAPVGAPMGGGPSAAATGTLTFFAGGAATALDRARPLLAALGQVEVVGADIGDGYTAKLIANLLWFGQVVAVTEALLLGQSLGVPPAVLRRTLAGSAGGSVFIDEYLDRLLEGDYLQSFGIDRCVEELDTLASLAAEEGVPFELSSVVVRMHREALERFGAVDGELLAARLLEERAGRTLRG